MNFQKIFNDVVEYTQAHPSITFTLVVAAVIVYAVGGMWWKRIKKRKEEDRNNVTSIQTLADALQVSVSDIRIIVLGDDPKVDCTAATTEEAEKVFDAVDTDSYEAYAALVKWIELEDSPTTLAGPIWDNAQFFPSLQPIVIKKLFALYCQQ